MADFDLEQLKTLFDNLADRLDKTKGDQMSRDELYKLRATLVKMSSKADKANSTSKANSSSKTSGTMLNGKDFASELVKEMRRLKLGQEPKRTTKSETSPKTKTPAPKQTIIQQEITRRQTNLSGLTFLDRALRETAGDVTEFGRVSKEAAEGMDKSARRREIASKAAWSAVAGSAGVMLDKFKKIGGERIDHYREILASGEGSITTIQDMGRQAVAAGVTVEQFAKAMTHAEAGARTLGGVRWLALNKSVTAMTRASGAMGMTAEKMQEYSVQYAEVIRLQGLSRDRNTQQMANGMISLVRSSEATANILGKTRDEALAMAKERASNTNVQATMEAKGYTDDQRLAMDDIAKQLKATYGDAGETLVNDMIQYGGPINESATQLAALMPELQEVVRAQVNRVDGDKNVDITKSAYDVAKSLNKQGRDFRNDRDRLGTYAQIAGFLKGPLTTDLTNAVAGSGAARNLKTDQEATRGSDLEGKGKEMDGTIGALGLNGLEQHFKVVGEAAINAAFNPLVTEFGPILQKEVNPALHSLADGLIKTANGLEGHSTGMANLTLGVIAASTALTAFTTGAGMFMKYQGIANGIRGGAGASGAIGTASRFAARALPVAGGAIAGGSLFMAGESMQENRKNESVWGTGKDEKGFMGSRGMGYLSSAAGGAVTGASIGSIFGVPGALIGGGIGAVAGIAPALKKELWDDPEPKKEAPKPEPKKEPVKPQTIKQAEPKKEPPKPVVIKAPEPKKEPEKKVAPKPEPKKEPPKPIVIKAPEPKKEPPKPAIIKPVAPKPEPRILALPKQQPKKEEAPEPKTPAKEPAKPVAPMAPLADRMSQTSLINTTKNQLSNGAIAPKDARAPAQPLADRPKQNTANATGQKNKNMLSADQMTNKIMEASERSAGILKGIKDNSDKQIEIMREDLMLTRNMSDRLSRLLEEGNKNTKSIADLSA